MHNFTMSFVFYFLYSWIDVLDLNQPFNWRAEIREPFKMKLIRGLHTRATPKIPAMEPAKNTSPTYSLGIHGWDFSWLLVARLCPSSSHSSSSNQHKILAMYSRRIRRAGVFGWLCCWDFWCGPGINMEHWSQPMIGENRQLVTNELVEFQK